MHWSTKKGGQPLAATHVQVVVVARGLRVPGRRSRRGFLVRTESRKGPNGVSFSPWADRCWHTQNRRKPRVASPIPETKTPNRERLGMCDWWWSLTENQTHISAVSQPRSEALRPSRDSGEGFRATARAHDCKFREADWHSQLPQLPGNLGAATWLSSRLSP